MMIRYIISVFLSLESIGYNITKYYYNNPFYQTFIILYY